MVMTPVMPIDTREEWRAVVGCEGRYEVSSLGRVRSILRDEPYVLTPSVPVGCYPQVALAVARGIRETRTVHALVLEAFVGPRPSSRHEGAHNDGVKEHSALSNLAWKTFEENEADKRRHGTAPIGERNPFSELTDEQVLQIRNRGAAGEPGRSIARDFSVTEQTISKVLLRLAWPHVGGPRKPTRREERERLGVCPKGHSVAEFWSEKRRRCLKCGAERRIQLREERKLDVIEIRIVDTRERVNG